MKCEFDEFEKMQFEKKSPNRGGWYRWCELWILWKDDDYDSFYNWISKNIKMGDYNKSLLFKVSGWENGKITEQSYIEDIGVNDLQVKEDWEFYFIFSGEKGKFKEWYEHNYGEVIPDD